MPSPFPGMDPWLESPGVFPDFHNTFIANMRAAISVVLPPPYFAAIGTRVVVEIDTNRRRVEPDVDIFKPGGKNGHHQDDPPSSQGNTIATAAHPVVVHVQQFESIEWTLEVRAGEHDDDLITSIEILSRSNKRPGRGRKEYLRKQKEMMGRQVHLVELDLLRSGRHTTAVPGANLHSDVGAFDYHISIWRADRPADFEIYPILVTQQLPNITIPLRRETKPITIDLQSVFDRTYDEANYPRRLRYDQPPDPPLSSEQAAWANNILREKGFIQ